ncbi:hypothetical protein ACGFX4_12130 [Kitasatospora sp. NPDC048365]|uniref:hypothetical protein n=1 Tax=Kitasatospora sp. NPDC048365 TaxID=3364050 RepID=UPI003722C82C
MSTTPTGPEGTTPPGLTLGPVRKPEAEPAVPPQLTAAEAADQTVRLGGKPVPEADHTVQLGGKPADVESTVRLGGTDPESTVRLGGKPVDVESTVRLSGADPEATVKLGGSDPEATVKLGDPAATVKLPPAVPVDGDATVKLPPAGSVDASEAGTVRLDPGAVAAGVAAVAGFESATHLDPEVWTTPVAEPTPTPTPAPAAAEEELHRFGPGVPPLAAAAWHGTDTPTEPVEPKRRRGRWLILPLVLLLGVLGWLGWDRYGKPVTVSAVEVRTDDAGPACDGTAVITGTVETDGGQGVVEYRWVRSDGTDSGTLRQQVSAGRHRTDVVLRWTFQGKGEMQATATLEVLSPSSRSAATTFTYTCR